MDRPPLPAAIRLEKEQADLAKAERDIAEGQMRVTAQELRIEQLRGVGHGTALAEELLATLKASLMEWYAHRDAILCTIRRLQAGER